MTLIALFEHNATTFSIFPVASLIATIFSTSLNNLTAVSTSIFEQVLPGTLYNTTGISIEFAKAL